MATDRANISRVFRRPSMRIHPLPVRRIRKFNLNYALHSRNRNRTLIHTLIHTRMHTDTQRRRANVKRLPCARNARGGISRRCGMSRRSGGLAVRVLSRVGLGALKPEKPEKLGHKMREELD